MTFAGKMLFHHLGEGNGYTPLSRTTDCGLAERRIYPRPAVRMNHRSPIRYRSVLMHVH